MTYNMNTLPLDVVKIIQEYMFQLNHAKKFEDSLSQIRRMYLQKIWAITQHDSKKYENTYTT